MNITQKIKESETYEVVAHAHVSREHFELESLMYHCKTSMNAVDITDFIYDYLSTDAIDELEQTIINQNEQYYE
tara:strand:- start:162 stop:383 length:222 start_codon:yes stop_codon:yes gene_type:complete